MRANQANLKNVMNEVQFKLDAPTARINDAEQFSYLEYKQLEKKEQEDSWDKQLEIHENKLREINNTMKCSKVRIIWIPEWVERED